MRTLAVSTVLLAGLLAAACGGSCPLEEPPVESVAGIEEARALAVEQGRLILADFHADWCAPCRSFDADLASDADLREAVAEFVFVKLDAGQAGGAEQAERHYVDSFPTFLVLRADGAVIDRWSGYGDAREFVARLREASGDRTTLAEKIERFEAEPSVAAALKLARIQSSRGSYATAVGYYRQAEKLDAASVPAGELFDNVYRSFAGDGPFTVGELRASAGRAMRESVAQAVVVGTLMNDLAKRRGDPSLAQPYLGEAIARSAGNDDPMIAAGRHELLIARALLVDGDRQRALALKRESLEPGWRDDAEALNGFAWWCFEQQVNLEEAERLARRGVELAADAAERALILDTVAEICNLRGDCGQALELIERAMAEDPQNDYYRQQRSRFEALLAQAAAR